MQQNDSTTSSEEDDVDGLPAPPPAKSSISIVSHDVMQVTVTKSLLEVLNNLSHVSLALPCWPLRFDYINIYFISKHDIIFIIVFML